MSIFGGKKPIEVLNTIASGVRKTDDVLTDDVLTAFQRVIADLNDVQAKHAAIAEQHHDIAFSAMVTAAAAQVEANYAAEASKKLADVLATLNAA